MARTHKEGLTMISLESLRALAEKAKAFAPKHWCSFNEAAWTGFCGEFSDGSAVPPNRTELPNCDSCAGAKRAVTDISSHIGNALALLDGRGDRGEGRPAPSRARHMATLAAKIASYFGDVPPEIAEFVRAVREACSDG